MDERTPLMLSEENASQSATRPAIEPVHCNAGDTQATINCQVCHQVVSFSARDKHVVVKCPNCTEATPIKGPPVGKQYVRCPCNCLLICNETTSRVGCPRPECQKVIFLNEDNGTPAYRDTSRGFSNLSHGTFIPPQTLRLACGNCNSPFSVSAPEQPSNRYMQVIVSRLVGSNSTRLIAAKCPNCRKLTSVGPAYARIRWVMYTILTIISVLTAIIVTACTAETANQNKSLYFLWSVLYLVSVVLGVRAIIFSLMPVSLLDVPVLQI